MYIHFTIHLFSITQSSALNTANIDFVEKMGHML
jgi:hypothetical protein